MAAGNVRGAMRPQGRSPSFFIVGLFLAVAILGFNYWSLSKRNHDLATQLLNMQDQLRLCISKRMNVERRGSNIVNELKKCETALDMDKNEVARKESELISLTEKLKNKEAQIGSDETKLKEMNDVRLALKTCEENSNGITQELQKKKEELKSQQTSGVNAETCKVCKGQWVSDQKVFLNGIDKVLGPNALLQLKNAGVDIGNYAFEISAQLKNNPPSQNSEMQQQQQTHLLQDTQVNPQQISGNQEPVKTASELRENAAPVPPGFEGAAAAGGGGINVVGSDSDNSIRKAVAAVMENPQRNPDPNNNIISNDNNKETNHINVNPADNVINNNNNIAPPAPNNEGIVAGNQGVPVPPNNNNVVPAPAPADSAARDIKNIAQQNNNDPAAANINGNIISIGDLDLQAGPAAKKVNVMDGAVEGNLLNVEKPNFNENNNNGGVGDENNNINNRGGDVPVIPHELDSSLKQPKLELNQLNPSLLDIIKTKDVLPENLQLKINAGFNEPREGLNASSQKKGLSSLAESSLIVTQLGTQNVRQMSVNTLVAKNSSKTVQINTESPALMSKSLNVTILTSKSGSNITQQRNASRNPITLSNALPSNFEPIAKVKEDHRKNGNIEDGIETLQKNMDLEENKLNSLEKH
ncbi:hypothetical protein Ahia01_000001300 [Argonauta hians]